MPNLQEENHSMLICHLTCGKGKVHVCHLAQKYAEKFENGWQFSRLTARKIIWHLYLNRYIANVIKLIYCCYLSLCGENRNVPHNLLIYIFLFYCKYALLFHSQSIWCASGFITITDYWRYNKIGHCWC